MPTTPPPQLTPYLTPDHHRLWAEADVFAADVVAPCVPRMETTPNQVERAVPQRLAEQGWFGVTIPTRYGGMGAGHVAKTILIHRLAAVSAAAAAIFQASLIPYEALRRWGTAEQKEAWLPPAADGSLLWSIAVTEPEAGGHIGGIETAAERRGRGWVLTGEKLHIGNSHIAGMHLVVARTASADVTASQALTAFIVEDNREGVALHPHSGRLGLHGFSAGRLSLDRVKVPDDHVLGEVGEGLYVALSSSTLCGLPNLTAVSLGLHEAVVDLTAEFLSNRHRYKGHLADLPVAQDRLGDMQARLHNARTGAYAAVHLLDEGASCDEALLTAKYTGHQLASQSGKDAMELHGARALDADYALQRIWRDIQNIYPPAGTGEFQRLRLAQYALGTEAIQWSQHFAAEAAWTRPAPDPTAA
jgi:alkylation response protein AidB-like acyl-CoA dehydrogenase